MLIMLYYTSDFSNSRLHLRRLISLINERATQNCAELVHIMYRTGSRRYSRRLHEVCET